MADDKLIDRHFEFFKHITTLDSGATLVVLVIYRDVGMERVDLIGPLLGFGASLILALVALVGMAGGAYHIPDEDAPPRWMLGWAAGLFTGGLVMVALLVLWPPVSSVLQGLSS